MAETVAREVWDGSVAPGGYVCSICGMPTESEPCEHLSAAGGGRRIDLARRWHRMSDHAADGTPFGGGLCNCARQAERVAALIAEWLQAEFDRRWDAGDHGAAETVQALADQVRP